MFVSFVCYMKYLERCGNCLTHRYDVTTLPQTDEGLKTWCIDRWREKEERLAHFYKHKHFPSTDASGTTSTRDAPPPTLEMTLGLLVWIVHMTLYVYLLFNCALVRYFAWIATAFFILITHVYGGYDTFQLKYTDWFYKFDENTNKKK